MVDDLRRFGVVPVAVVQDVAQGLRLCEALCEGGLTVIEVTFRTAAAAETIAAVRERFPQMHLGAGTVLSVADLQRAREAGATFAVAPGCNPEVVRAAVQAEFAFFPGIATPTDIELALSLGVRTLKYFPAEALGGVKLLSAMLAAYRHTGVRFIPTGGIKAANMGAYLALPEVPAVGGSWMVAKELLQNEAFAKVTQLAREAVEQAGERGT